MIEKVQFKFNDDVTVVNKEQYEAHLRLYEGYVKKINEIDEFLAGEAGRPQANTTYSSYREAKRGETFAMNGVILHELYFENIGGSESEPNQKAREILNRDFGGVDNWREDFTAAAKASRGWVALSFDQRSGRMRNVSLDAHDVGIIAYSAPVLVLDMYEHAYFLQYADNKNAYIDNFMKNINWEVIGKRFSFY